jgi:hypothetical protein
MGMRMHRWVVMKSLYAIVVVFLEAASLSGLEQLKAAKAAFCL